MGKSKVINELLDENERLLADYTRQAERADLAEARLASVMRYHGCRGEGYTNPYHEGRVDG